MIIQKAMQCVRRGCRAFMHAQVDTSRPVVVPVCIKCGGPCAMYMGHAQEVLFSPATNLALDDLVDLALAGSATHRKLASVELQGLGYKLIGFHGCTHASAYSLVHGKIDVHRTKNTKRGPAFYVGNLYDGLASEWADIAASRSKGTAVVLGVHAADFDEWEYGEDEDDADFDWGKMDSEDVASDGKEMAIFETATYRVRLLPALVGDVVGVSWAGCPDHDKSCEDRNWVERHRMRLQPLWSQYETFEDFFQMWLYDRLSEEQESLLVKLRKAK